MIYFLRHKQTGLIKIGLTAAVSFRHRALESMYGELELMGFQDGEWDEEQALHRQFASAHSRGVLWGKEWFSPTAELIAYIAENTSLDNTRTYEKLRPENFPPQNQDVPNDSNWHLESCVPDLIKAYLVQTGMRANEFAQICGMDVAAVSRHVNSNPRRIDLDTADRFRAVIGFEPKHLVKVVVD